MASMSHVAAQEYVIVPSLGVSKLLAQSCEVRSERRSPVMAKWKSLHWKSTGTALAKGSGVLLPDQTQLCLVDFQLLSPGVAIPK